MSLSTPSQSRPRAIAISSVCTLAVLAALTGCKQGGGGNPPVMPVEVDAVQASTSPVEDRLAAVGSLQANEQTTLMPEAPGRIKAILFEEGQRVTVGAPLFELDDEKEAAQLALAAADLDLARQNAKRAEALAETKAISRQEIDQMRAQVNLKEASRLYQEKRAREMHLSAPFAGVLGPRAVSLGQFVNVGTALVTLTDDTRIKVQYRLPERHLPLLKAGQEVTLRVSAFPDKAFPGKVDLVNPEVDQQTRTVQLRALVPNPDGLLKPGMFAHVETITGRRDDAIVIPERAVVPSLAGFSVYTIVTNTARAVAVEIGQRMEGKVEIRKGLTAGQPVIVGGLQKIIDGTLVTAAPQKGLSATATASTNAPAL